MRRRAESRWGRGVVLVATFSLALASNLSYFFLVAPVPRALAGPEPVQIAYIPMPEDDIVDYFQALYGPSGATIRTNISFTSAGDGVIVYYDHWEDGFEADIANPVQATTQVWGDGDLGNGVAPGYPTDLLNSGDSVILENDIPTPRVQADQFFDGGDKIASTRGIAITRAAYPTSPGPVAAASTSVYDTSRYGTSFTTPIGEDTPTAQQGGSNGMFAYTALTVIASEENTTVTIDTDGDGTVDITTVIDEGESYYVDGGVDEGATITSDAPILAGLMTGDSNNAIEGRWFELLPTAFWADSYITPVGTSGSPPTDVILYNPNGSSITVDVTTNAGAAGSVNIAANSSARHRMPSNSGARLASTLGQSFGAISTIDYDNSANDWGFAVVPESLLTTRIVTGWAPGSQDLTVNGSPVWLTAPATTRIYVDYGNSSPGLLTDPNGDPYDVHFDVNAFDMVRVFDPDLDQTGLSAYTLNDVVVSAAWGQDPATAGCCNPYLDLGTSIFPFTALYVTKDATHVIDQNGNGLVEPGDVLEYQVAISDAGNLALLNVVMSDPLPANTLYVPGSTTIDGSPIADDTVPPAATEYPFDESGYSIGTVNPGQTVDVRFRVQIDAGLSPGVSSVINTVTVTANNASGTAAVETPVVVPDLSVTKSSSVTGSVRAGDTIFYSVIVENTGSLTHTNLSINDPAPTGTTWQATTITGPVAGATGNVRDQFDTVSYGNDDGSDMWSGNWVEIDSGTNQSPTSGDIRIVSNLGDNRLRVKDDDRDVWRVADLSAYNAATLTYDFRRVGLDSAGDFVSVYADDGATRTELARYSGASVSTDSTYTTVTHDLSGFDLTSGTMTISFESSGSLGNGDNVYFDNVDISAENRTISTYPGNAPDPVASGTDLRPGETITVLIEVLVDTPVAPGITSIDNTATVFSDIETDGQSAFASNPLERINDLVITKTDSPDPVLVGQPLTYTINVTNNGPDISTGTVVTDTLPADVTYSSATPTQGSCSEAGGVVTCTLGDIAVAGSTGVVVVVTPDAPAANTTITNTAVVTSDPTELVPADNTATAATDVDPSADLAISKTDSVDPAWAGVAYTYTVTIDNNGPNAATSVVATDTLPAGLTYVSAIPDQGSCVEAAGVVTCSLGTVGVSSSVDIVIMVIPTVAIENTTVTNDASVTSPVADVVPGNNSTSEDTDIDPAADLNVTKSDDLDPVLVGDTLTYTVTVLNEGVSTATNVVMTDVLPANVTFMSATPDQGSCSELSGIITCSLGTILATADVDIVIVVTPDVAAGNTTITNNASATADEADPDSSDDSTSEDTDVDPKTDLALTKTASPDPVLAGDQLIYTLTVTNNGPSASTGSTVTDVLAAGVTFNEGASSGSCGEAAGTVTCTTGAITSGSNQVLTVVVDLDPSLADGSMLTNNASVVADEADPVAANNTASDRVTVNTEADLAVTKTDSVDPVLAGNGLTYTVTATNNGPSDAQAVTLTDSLPAGVTFVSATPSSGSCSETGGVVTCSFGTIAAGANESVVIAVNVPADAADGATLTNTASVSSPTIDPNAADNSTSEDTTVATEADLSITKADSADPVTAGDPLTYTLLVTNSGPSDAQAVVATDTLPAGVTFGSASSTQGSCVEAAGVVTCTIGTIADGGSVTVTVEATVDADVADGTILSNTAAVSATTTDPTPGNDSVTETTTVGAEADLSITKSDTPDPVTAGTNLTYTIIVVNNGPSDAQSVVVTDVLPAGVAYVSATPTQGSCSEAAGTVTCSLGTIADMANAIVTLVVAVDSSTTDGSTISNTATVSSATTDPVAGNDSATATTTVETSADLSITKSDSPDPVLAGNDLTYTVTVTNTGPSDAQAVTVTDVLPSGVAFVSATPTQGSCSEGAGTLTCPLGGIADGANATITIVVTVDASTADGASLVNSASVATTTTDPVAANDSASATTAVNTTADLSVTKVDSVDPVVAGNTLSYTVTVANAGPSDAAAVVLTDVLPAGVTYASATPDQGSCSEAAGTVTCLLGVVDAGDSVDVVIAVTVDSNTPAGTITNTASVAALTADPNGANDATSEDTTVTTSADVSVAKVDSADPVVAGTGFSYTVTVANSGPSDATSVSLTDVLPAGVTFASATPDQGSCSELAGTVTCALGTIASGASVDVVIAVTVDSDTPGGTITNNAGVTTATTDPNAANDATSEDTTTTVEADVGVSKVDSADPVAAGGTYSYTVSVDNLGPSDATGVTVTDVLPSLVGFTSAVPDQGSCSEVTGTVTCSLGTLVAGASVDIVITVSVGGTVPESTVLVNTVSLTSTTSDPVAANDSDSETTTVAAIADLGVSKDDAVDPVTAGTSVTYTVTVDNNGPSDTDSVTMTDTLPAEVTFVSATPDQGFCSEAAGVVTCTLGTMADGASVDVVIVATVDAGVADGTTITNMASVSSAAADPTPGNDTTSEDTLIATSADLSISKVDSVDPVIAGNALTYTVTVSNGGPSDALAVSMVDALPTGVSFISATPDQGSCSEAAGVVNCALGTIAAGGIVDIVIAVTVDSDTTGTLTNAAFVSTTTPDPVAGNDSTTESTTVDVSADLAISKTDNVDPVVAGTNLTYTVSVVNNGPSDATSVTMTDTLPAGVGFVSATPDQGSCSEAAGVVTCALGTIAAGGSVDVVIVVFVPSATADGSTLTNAASVSSAVADPTPGNDSTSEDTTVATSADLSVMKVDSVDPVTAGSGLSYTVTVANAGPSQALGVTVTDVLPAGVTFVSATPDQGSCSEVGGTVTCSLGAIGDGGSVEVVIVVTVDDATLGTITNTASITATTTDPVPGNDNTSEDTKVVVSADVGLSKVDSADPVTAGTGFSYTVTVSNSGPSQATDATMTDVLPAEVSYVSATPDQGSCSEAAGTVTCSLGSISSGGSVDVVISVMVPSDQAAATITNNASVTTTAPDPNAANDATSEDTTVVVSADVGVTKVDSADPVVAGTGFSYTVTVANAGPSDATGVTLIDVLPAGVTFVSATPDQGSCSEAAGTVTCSLGAISGGGSADIVIAVTVDSDTAAGTITNTASITSTAADPNAANDATSEDTTITTSADLSVTKTDSADPVVAGTGFSYTVTVANAGPSDATDVTLTDVLPAGVTYVSATPDQGSCSEAAGTVTCLLGTIANGGSVDVAIAVTADGDTTGTITNNASVSSSTTDPNGANDSTSEDTTISTSADVSVTKVDSADPVVAGTGFSYTVAVANAGPSDAMAVTVTDVLPAGVTFVSATPDQGSCSEAAGTVTCSLGGIAGGGSADVVIAVTVDSDTAAGTITNNASVSTATTDPNAANDATSEDTAITTSADVSVSKIDSADPVVAGTGFSYTVTVANAGPSDAASVSLSDVLPADVTYVSASPDQGSCAEAAGTVTCSLGTIAAGGSVEVAIAVTVDADTPAGTITNNASVTTSTTDPNAANDSTGEDTAIVTSADVSVTKVDSVDPVSAGDSFSYTVTVANAGPSDADSVVVTDVLPAGVSFVSATPAQGTCAEAAGTVACSLGTVASGGSVDVVIAVTVDDDTPSGTITNTATVTTTMSDPNAANDSASEGTTITTSADLSVSKVDSADPVVAGTGFSYTVTVANAGPSDASGVSLTDTLPAGVSFVSATPDQGSCAEAAGIVTCSLGLIAASGSVDVVIAVTVDDDAPAGTITNNATVSSATPETNGTDNSTSEDTTVTSSADLAITKTDSPDGVLAGATLTYTLDVTNSGPSDAAAVTVIDTVPAGVAFVSAVVMGGSGTESCVEAAGTVTCSLGVVANGSTETVTIVTTVSGALPEGTVLTNTASVTSSTPDPDGSDNSDSEDTTVVGVADVSVTKSDSPDPIVAGTNLTYTIVVSDLGPGTANGVVVSDPLPAGATFVSAVVAGGSGTESCSEAAGTVTCSLGDVAVGSDETITLVVAVGADVTDGTVLSNTATVTSTTQDPVAVNDSDTETTTVSSSADISIVKTDSVDPVVAGTSFAYTVVVANAGPSDATSVSLADTLPAGVSYVSGTVSGGSGTETCNELGGVATCDLGLLGSGASETISIVVTVDASIADGTVLSNTATVTSATADPAPANNADTETTTVSTSADLAVTKVDSTDPVVAGTGLSYTVTVANAGPSDATAVTMTDVLPGAVTFVSATPDQGSCAEAAGTVTCSLGTIAAGAGVDVVIAIGTTAATPLGTVTNTASVSATTADLNASNDTTSEDTTIVAEADLAVTKLDSVDPVVAGTSFSYTVTVANGGPSDAPSVVLTDPLPAGLGFLSAVPDQGSCSELGGTVTCSLGTIANGASVDVVITVSVPSDAVAGSSYVNTASVSSAATDPYAANDSDSESTLVSADADLSITKTDTVDPASAGSALTYTLTVANAGPSDAAAVTVTDTLPAGLSFANAVPGQGSCVEAAATVTCSLGTIAAGGVVVITMNVTVDADVPDGSTLVNAASVSSPTPDSDPSDNSATESTAVVAAADLSITKTDSADPVVPGEPLDYIITVSNAGPSDAQAVIVSDVLPADLTFVSAVPTQGSCVEAAGTVTCTLGAVPSGGSVTIALSATVDASATAPIVNIATVSSATSDPIAGNNSVTESTAVGPEADLWITKSSAPVPFAPGGPIAYTIVVGNDGPSAVVGATVTDVLPIEVLTPTWTCVGAGGGTCAGAGVGDISESVDLPAGATVTFTVVGTVDPAVSASTIISNTATATPPGGVTDPDPTDNADTDANPFSPDADLAIAKSAAPGTVTAGETLTFTVAVTNNGLGDAADVAVTDVLPGGVTFVSATVTGGSGTETCGEAGGVVSCALGALSTGATETITVVVTVDPSTLGSIDNTASVTASTTDPDLSDNSDSASVAVVAEADLSLTKSVTPSTVDVGDALTYTIVVTNGGPADATAVAVTDPIPPGITIDSATSSQGSCSLGATLSCSIGTMAPGASVTITLDATATAAGTIVNTATVSSDTADPDSADDSEAATVVVSGVGAIRSIVWWDLDKDGAQDAAEPVLDGITVELYNDGGSLVATDVTTASGGYEFTGLTPADYEIRIVGSSVPAGATLVSDPVGAVDGVAAITVVAGTTADDLDFGYAGSATLDGTVFHDVDGDDTHELPFEPGLPFVVVTATWAGPDGSIGTSDDVAFSVSTDAFGAYEFDCLPPGTYRVTITESTLPGGLEVTTSPHPATRSLGTGGSATADFGAAGNSAPYAVDDAATTPQTIPVTVPVLGNDTDPEGDPIAVTVIGTPSNGSVALSDSGTVTYTPDADFTGVDTFVYTIVDEDGDSDTAVVTITVTPVNQPPGYTGPPSVPVEPGGPLPSPPVDDPDDDETTIEIIEGELPDGVELIDGQLVGTPTEEGQFSVTVRICDSAGNCVDDTIIYVIDELPFTGADSDVQFAVAVALIVGGWLLIVASRRREAGQG